MKRYSDYFISRLSSLLSTAVIGSCCLIASWSSIPQIRAAQIQQTDPIACKVALKQQQSSLSKSLNEFKTFYIYINY